MKRWEPHQVAHDLCCPESTVRYGESFAKFKKHFSSVTHTRTHTHTAGHTHQDTHTRTQTHTHQDTNTHTRTHTHTNAGFF